MNNPETIAKLQSRMKGRKLSLETIAKIKSKLKGRKFSIETITKMKLRSNGLITVINMNNTSKKEYSSIHEVAKTLNVCLKTIYNYMNTEKLLKNTYLIKKVYEKTRKVHNSLPTIVINTVTQQICEYPSIKEVAKKFKVSDTTIKDYILNNKKHQNVFIIKLLKNE
jgi:NUMOD1 domain-containing protein